MYRQFRAAIPNAVVFTLALSLTFGMEGRHRIGRMTVQVGTWLIWTVHDCD